MTGFLHVYWMGRCSLHLVTGSAVF